MTFVAVLSSVLLKIFYFLIRRMVLSLGISVLAFVGYSYVLDKIQVWVEQGYNSLPSKAVQLLNISGFDVGIGIIFAAYSFRISLDTMNKVVFGAESN